jgi:hypothetical protein
LYTVCQVMCDGYQSIFFMFERIPLEFHNISFL